MNLQVEIGRDESRLKIRYTVVFLFYKKRKHIRIDFILYIKKMQTYVERTRV